MSAAPAAGYRVMVIDDHELFSTSLTMALRLQGLDARTVEVSAVPDFLHGPGSRPAGLVVLDLDLGQDAHGDAVNGADLVEDLRTAGWAVLVVSGGGNRPEVAAAIAAGAIGSVPKTRSFDVLLETVIAAASGEAVMSEAEYQDWRDRHRRHLAREREFSRRLSRLSRREREVLDLLGEGMRAAAIAQHFVVSMTTVRTQIRSLLAKLEVGSQLEAVALVRGQPEARGRRGDGQHCG